MRARSDSVARATPLCAHGRIECVGIFVQSGQHRGALPSRAAQEMTIDASSGDGAPDNCPQESTVMDIA